MKRSLCLSSLAVLSFLAAQACSSADPTVPVIGPHGGNTGGGTGNGNNGADSGGGGGGADSGTVTPSDDGGVTMTSDETWAAGKMLTTSVTIAAGVTVTIAPGAVVNAASGVSITVLGTLKASSQATHAKITGTSWGGITVGAGGTLSLVGVDLENAMTALATTGANTAATYDYGTITAASSPFSVGVGGKLSTSHAHVAGTKGMSSVGGSFTASFLSYDSGGNEGISLGDPSAILIIDDSKFFGTGVNSGDMINGSGAKIHFAYSEITAVHCAFHFNNVTQFDIDHANIHGNSYGFMLYGSGSTGARTVGFSNIVSNAAYGADEGSAQTVNGPITFHDGYWAMNGAGTAANVHKTTNAITVTNMSTTTPVAGVGPRGTL